MDRCCLCERSAVTTTWSRAIPLPACAEHAHDAMCLADDLDEERAALVRTWQLRATSRPQLAP